jgi:cobalt transporter subunit CbtB
MSDTRVDTLRPEATTTRVAGVASALVATLLGAFLVLGAGFAPISAVHNAAHDARHAFAFPCH